MVEYSGMSFAMFFLAEYANIILVSTLAVGACSSAAGCADLVRCSACDAGGSRRCGSGTGSGSFAKTFVVATMFLWVRATFPRFRYDQIMRLGWKIFIPVTLVWLVVVGLWIQSPWNIWK